MQQLIFRTAESGDPFDVSWDQAQSWCNFVLFKPTTLPEGLVEVSNKMRPETSEEPSSHRIEFRGAGRALSMKQFLYDWAPPAYDHPCLWRNAKISTPENTPLPKPYLIGNNYLWFGLDYRRKPAATINMSRTQLEITVLEGEFQDQEIIDLVKLILPNDVFSANIVLSTSFAELMFNHRHEVKASPVPTSYFDHKRSEDIKCYPYSAGSKKLNADLLPGKQFMYTSIENYRLDSIITFGQDQQDTQEVEYYFESLIEPGSYIRFLVTKTDAKNPISYPTKLGDQECNYAVQELENGENLYHAWSKTNDNGAHSLVFKTQDCLVNCLIKPAPWTTVDWARNLCAQQTS